jgi:hypothetical protein
MPIISIGAQQHRLLAPGAVARFEYQAKILNNPFNKRNRQVLHDNYGIQLPLIEKQQQQQRTVIFLFCFSGSLHHIHSIILFSHHQEIFFQEKQLNHLEYYHLELDVIQL